MAIPVTCSVCNRPLNVHQQARGGLCDDIACRTTAAKWATARQQAEHQARLETQVQVQLPVLLGHEPRTGEVATVIISARGDRLELLTSARREKFRESLAQALLESDAESPPSLDDLQAVTAEPDAASRAAAGACATCRGFCCRTGGDTGYIDARTVRRVRTQQPDLTPVELLALYLVALPEHSVADSCVFHGEQGCTLPRTLRSRVCNDYFCWPLRQRLASPATVPTAVFIFQDEQLLRSRLLAGEPPAVDP